MKITNETLTGGIFYCRVRAEIKGCGSLETLYWFDSDELRNSLLKMGNNLPAFLLNKNSQGIFSKKQGKTSSHFLKGDYKRSCTDFVT